MYGQPVQQPLTLSYITAEIILLPLRIQTVARPTENEMYTMLIRCCVVSIQLLRPSVNAKVLLTYWKPHHLIMLGWALYIMPGAMELMVLLIPSPHLRRAHIL